MTEPGDVAELEGETLKKLLSELDAAQQREYKVYGISRTPSNLKIKHEANFSENHKLSPEDRAQRRADNKAMKKIRQTNRKRRKHGR